ncbi:unnamed protein product [Chironomus riparius]|uniref:DNA replication ATP-dependent helicase/nuclease n=1 Tax=Chironomus riparius TaxID=315576 RepID=A0A9N9S1M0_9DIPT|nr:unnamed protein product [Chironomus riparius]
MEKRAFTLVDSPQKCLPHDVSKKVKISVSPKKCKENNGNIINKATDDFDFDGLMFDDDDDIFLEMVLKNAEESNKPLDLTDFKRCKVNFIEIHPKTFEKILHLEEKKTKKFTKCCLKGIWFDTNVAQNDIVSVKGIWNEERKLYFVSNDSGIIVVLPDFLVSGTTVVGSLFCTRKSVLSERFRGVDFDDTLVMHVGSIVHEIIQKAMKDNLTTLKEVKRASEEVLNHANIIQLLYACKISPEDLKSQIDPFIDRIFHFMQQYFVGNSQSQKPSNGNDSNKQFMGRIAEVQDIEENVWSPHLGLKGKIDATVTVYPPNQFFNSFRKLIPVEIKTGKSSYSLEHKGQLILYQLMMRDLGKQIDSGLLLYIRDGLMSEIRASRPEESGLISMRNRLAKYLNTEIVTREKTINLPEPIKHPTACQKCSYNVLCCAFLEKDENYVLQSNHPLFKIQESAIAHLTIEHYNYFLQWCHLITLEHNEGQRPIKLKHLWTKSADERATKGNALANLIIKDFVVQHGNEFVHPFTSSNSQLDFTQTNFDIGEYLIVSTDKRCSITAGRVYNIKSTQISLLLPKDISRQYANEKFHLDKHESQSQSVFNFSNIGILLENNDEKGINRLRSIIVDKMQPQFSNSLPKSIQQKIDQTLLEMNPVQRNAILKALTCESYMLIKGLPGTGKTQTLVNLIHLLMVMKKSIIITSHTNSAVDNILLRLKERRIKFLRLGSVSRIHKDLHDYCEATLIEKCHSVEDLKELYSKYQIVAVTCLGSAHALLANRRFDYCLVDESTQIFQPTVIRPLLSADRFILVGDPDQLSPLVRSNEARLLGANQSLFERLDSKEATSVLGLQYRMNKTITKLANNLTYNNELKCANEKIEKAVMEVPNVDKLKEQLSSDKWLAKVLTSHLDQACSLINTGNVYEMATGYFDSVNMKERKEKSKLYVNYCEIAIVMHIVDILIDCGVSGESIGIIASYRDQVEALKKIFESYKSVEVNTVDQYQGRDKKIIIYSCTMTEITNDGNKSSKSLEVEILEDRRRLTVAITRAKHKLIMIGDVNCLNKYTPFRDLFRHMNSISKVQLQDEKFGFSWEKLMKSLKEKLI